MRGLLLLADMEGCVGVHNMRAYEESRQLMIKDTELIINQILKSGYDRLAIIDCHDSGYNLKPLQEKYPQITIVSHVWNMHNWYDYQDSILIGFHAMRGGEGNHAHTLRPEIESLMLGNKKIGEIEWLVNTLAYYGIHVKCITGELGAQKEAGELGIPFFGTDGQTVEKEPDIYKAMAGMVAKALDSGAVSQYKYNDAPIELIFTQGWYSSYIPEGLYSLTERGVIFSSVLEMNERVFGVCKFLNAGNEYRYELINCILHMARSFYTKESMSIIPDGRFQDLMGRKDKASLDIKELLYIRKVLQDGIA